MTLAKIHTMAQSFVMHICTALMSVTIGENSIRHKNIDANSVKPMTFPVKLGVYLVSTVYWSFILSSFTTKYHWVYRICVDTVLCLVQCSPTYFFIYLYATISIVSDPLYLRSVILVDFRNVIRDGPKKHDFAVSIFAILLRKYIFVQSQPHEINFK